MSGKTKTSKGALELRTNSNGETTYCVTVATAGRLIDKAAVTVKGMIERDELRCWDHTTSKRGEEYWVAVIDILPRICPANMPSELQRLIDEDKITIIPPSKPKTTAVVTENAPNIHKEELKRLLREGILNLDNLSNTVRLDILA